MINVQGGNGLFFDSGIDLTELQEDANKANNILSSIGSKGISSVTSQIKQQGSELEGFAQKAFNTIETLRAKVLARQDFIIRETDLTKIAQYNREIQALETEISRLQNVGKAGFDQFGNAIPNAIDKTAKSTNLLTKGFSFFRQAAYLIPGIGIAGIFNLIAQGATALITQLFKGGDATSVFAKNFQNLKDVMGDANKEAGKQIGSLKVLYEEATNANIPLTERLRAVKDLQTQFPEYFANITQEAILNGKAKDAYEALKDSILAAARARAADAKIQKLETDRLDIEDEKRRIKAEEADKVGKAATSRTVVDFNLVSEQNKKLFDQGKLTKDQLLKLQGQNDARSQALGDIDNMNKKLAEQDDKLKSISEQESFLTDFINKNTNGKTDNTGRLAQIDKEISDQKKLQEQVSSTSVQYQEFQRKINALEAERKSITGDTLKETKAAESAYNIMLDKRKQLLEAIDGIKGDAKRSGFVQEQSELDKVATKYDTLIQKVNDFNEKTKLVSAKTGKQVPLISTDSIIEAKSIELTNTRLKQQAADYEKFLGDQQAMFTKFEEAKKKIGIDKATEMFAAQTKGFESNQAFLEAEAKKMLPKIQAALTGFGGLLNIGDIQKIKALFDALQKSKQAEQQQQLENFQELLNQSVTFEDKRIAIETKFNKLFETLKDERVHMSDDEYQRRLASLKQSQAQEEKELRNEAVRQSDIYKKIGEDTIRFTISQLRERVTELKQVLQQGFLVGTQGLKVSLTPEMIASIKAAIKQFQDLANSSDKTIVHLDKFIEGGTRLKAPLEGLAQALEPFNKSIGDSLTLMSQLLSSTLQMAQGLKDFKVAKNNGDIEGQLAASADIVTAVLSAVSNAIAAIKKGKQSKLDADKEMADFQTQLITGALEYNQVLRDRERQQVTLNKLTLDGLNDEKKLLEQQKQASQQSFNDILKQLQAEQFVVSESEKKKRGSLLGGLVGFFSGTTTEIQQQLDSLAGKSFEEIEKLFDQGQLTDKAKALFEQLEKLKQEGADIDQMLAENKQRADELFTGTTSDSILDAITDGFAQGKHSAADFAGDFEDLMRQAMINTLKFKYLEGPLKDFFDQFAASSESDSTLTDSEIANLKDTFNKIITNADKQFTQLQQIAGINLASGATADQNTLTGAFRGLTEDTGNLLAGQFAGQRVATIELLAVQRSAIQNLVAIETNTAITFQEIRALHAKMEYYFRDQGVKVR